MASYDLTCRECGKDFEVFVLGFLKDEAKVCPECGAHNVEQRFTGFGGVMGLSPSSNGSREPRSCQTSSGFS